MAVERSNESIEVMSKEVKEISDKFEDLINGKAYTINSLEFRNLLSIAKLIVKHSTGRSKNSGVFYNRDL
jgi:aspartate oxidase